MTIRFGDIREPKRRCHKCKSHKLVLGGRVERSKFTCAECRTDKKPVEMKHAA